MRKNEGWGGGERFGHLVRLCCATQRGQNTGGACPKSPEKEKGKESVHLNAPGENPTDGEKSE